jgi:hypothetical protein
VVATRGFFSKGDPFRASFASLNLAQSTTAQPLLEKRMAHTSTKRGRGRSVLKTAARAGGIVVATGLIAGVALAKDEKKSKDESGKKSAMAVKTAPGSAMAVKTAPGGTTAWKVAPNSAMAVKTAPGGAVAVKTAPNGEEVKSP